MAPFIGRWQTDAQVSGDAGGGGGEGLPSGDGEGGGGSGDGGDGSGDSNGDRGTPVSCPVSGGDDGSGGEVGTVGRLLPDPAPADCNIDGGGAPRNWSSALLAMTIDSTTENVITPKVAAANPTTHTEQ